MRLESPASIPSQQNNTIMKLEQCQQTPHFLFIYSVLFNNEFNFESLLLMFSSCVAYCLHLCSVFSGRARFFFSRKFSFRIVYFAFVGFLWIRDNKSRLLFFFEVYFSSKVHEINVCTLHTIIIFLIIFRSSVIPRKRTSWFVDSAMD